MDKENKLKREAKVRRELEDYINRKFEIEEMKLELKELEIECSMVNAQQYKETVQSSRECPNNDTILNKKDSLEKRINIQILRNQRIEAKVKRVRKRIPQLAIKKYYIDGKDKKTVSIEIERSVCQVGNAIRCGIELLASL